MEDLDKSKRTKLRQAKTRLINKLEPLLKAELSDDTVEQLEKIKVLLQEKLNSLKELNLEVERWLIFTGKYFWDVRIWEVI